MERKQSIKAFRDDFAVAVAALEKKYAVKVTLGSISYDELSFSTKMKVVSVSESDPTGEIADWNKNCDGYFKKSEYGTRFSLPDGRVYALCGFKWRSCSPILARRDDGKVYRFPLEFVKEQLKKQA
jgi:hypothetical protein